MIFLILQFELLTLFKSKLQIEFTFLFEFEQLKFILLAHPWEFITRSLGSKLLKTSINTYGLLIKTALSAKRIIHIKT